MLDTKQVTLDDKGVSKVFTITELPAMQAMKLLREVLVLMADTELIKAAVMQQMIQNIIQTGTKIEGIDNDQLESMMQLDTPTLISNLIQSIVRGLDDVSMETLINKCMSSVVYHNGQVKMPGADALECGMIKDFVVLMALVYEVFMLNFSGAIDRIKKLLGRQPQNQSQPSI